MTDEKKPPQEVAFITVQVFDAAVKEFGALRFARLMTNKMVDNHYRWAVVHEPDGSVALTIFNNDSVSLEVAMNAETALFMAYTLLTNGRDNFDAAATAQRLAALALACQKMPYRHDNLSASELTISHDDIGDVPSVVFDLVGNGGQTQGELLG